MKKKRDKFMIIEDDEIDNDDYDDDDNGKLSLAIGDLDCHLIPKTFQTKSNTAKFLPSFDSSQILIVDDNEINIFALDLMIKQLCKVKSHSALNGKEAIKKILEQK